MRTSMVCVIPAYNEEATVGDVVAGALKHCPIVLVIDDGSVDRTAEKAADAGALVLSHPFNLGVGAAIYTGLEAAKRFDPEVVVMIDADGQHNPDEIPAVAEPVKRGEADLVIGSRFAGDTSSIPFVKRLGNKLLTSITSAVCRHSLSDSQSGFRALSRRLLHALEEFPTGFAWASDMIAQAIRLGCRVAEVPVTPIYSEYSMKKGTGVFDGVKIFVDFVKRHLL